MPFRFKPWPLPPSLPRLALLPVAVLLAACDGDPVTYDDSSRYEVNWTWAAGHAGLGEAGVYGSLGVPDPANQPGAREGAVTWIDADGRFWLFGGLGVDGSGLAGRLNDLWVREDDTWTWVGGSAVANTPGSYGTRGVADDANLPGGRSQATSWIDADGNLWLFGGNGLDASLATGRFADLWKYDPTANQWTWVAGPDALNQPGIYGTRGTADTLNAPGGRYGATGWVDDAGHFWLFGGLGYDNAAASGRLNDLWVWNGTAWAWMRGADTVAGAVAVYATADAVADNPETTDVDESRPAITADMVTPSGRQGASSWHLPDPDPANAANTETAWLFGGIGNDASGSRAVYAETWRFNGENWAFAHGVPSLGYTSGNYGGRSVLSLSSLPPSRSRAVAWTQDATLWMFGGAVETSASSGVVYPNDLWRYDAVGWTWAGGDNTLLNSPGSYPAATSGTGLPAGREGAAGWLSEDGKLWLFGGSVGSATNTRDDLWSFPLP